LAKRRKESAGATANITLHVWYNTLTYQPPPKELAGFPGAKSAKLKTSVQGRGGRRRRWKDSDGTLYEWDSQHGTVEKYDKRGAHLGEFDASTGQQTKPADPSRRVEP